jgi:HAD superfamily hydrolase (TIGR01509 family)
MAFKLDFKQKVLLFDFDGTIVQTETLARDVVIEYFAEKKLGNESFSLPFANLIVGRPWKSATELMVGEAKHSGLHLPSAEELYQEFKKRYRERFEKGVKLIPGILDVLPKLKAQAKFMGIVTGSERDEVMSLMNAHGLSPFFERIWAYGDYEFSKPDPSPFLTAMRDVGVGPTDCVVFEDSQAGMESAKRAGMPWVQIAHEAHSLTPNHDSQLVLHTWFELLN